MLTSEKIISCPHCKYQYLPGEIFIPNRFIGRPKNIIRNDNGEIIGYDGDCPSYFESYICDNCNQKFTLRATITFRCHKQNTHAEEPYVQEINKEGKIYLEEK